MTRWLAGSFDPDGQTASPRLVSALDPHVASIVTCGPLHVAYSGTALDAANTLCLLDGYLDNAEQLRVELQAPRDSPAEHLLALGWHRWGRGLLPRLRGDFVLILWDRERSEGLIARDQLGVRSLFLHDAFGKLCFAGEIRHLLALLPRRPQPDPVSVAHWLGVSSRPGAATLYTGIRRLNPGAMLLLDRHGAREEHYWTPTFAEPLEESEPQLAERTRAALDLAVRRRIGPDASTGVLMSGGLDSASVAAVASVQAPGRTSAYSGVFPEHPAVDESLLIDELRSSLRLGGLTAQVRAGGLLASAIDAAVAWQAPLLGWGDFWTLPLLRAASADGIRIMLGGDGGDELFGARVYLLADRLRGGHPFDALALARELPGAGDRPPRRQLARMMAEVAAAGALPYGLHEGLRRPLAGRGVPAWLLPAATRDLVDSDEPLAWKRLDGPRWWANAAHGLTRGIEETGIFEHQRRRAASAGLDARHPLFDLDLLELALRQPPAATFDRYRSRPVLRAATSGLLPDTVRLRPAKAWFDTVLIDCLSGPDSAAVRQLLTGPGAELGAYVDQGKVRRDLLEKGPSGSSDRFRWLWQVWRLLTAECWLRTQADPNAETLRTLGAGEARVELRRAPDAVTGSEPYVFPP